jgi:hypothetical protein
MDKINDGLYLIGEDHNNLSWTMLEGSLNIVLCKSGHGKVLRELGINRINTMGGGWIIGNKLCFQSGSIHAIPKELNGYAIETIQQHRPVYCA